MATRYTSLGTAALIAGSIGASVYTASTAQSAREAISAAHDPTTAHGEIAVRVDAGGADVTALAAVDPGTPTQVLTVSDSGVPVWRDPAGGTSWGATVVDPMTGSGWTGTVPSGMTATWGAGVLTMSVPAGTTGTIREDYPVTLPSGTTAWDIATRIQVTTGVGTTLAAGVYVIIGTGLSRYVGVNVRGDGHTDISYNVNGTVTTTGYLASTLTIGGGQSWLRVSRSTTGVWSVWLGEGVAGALPTLWVRRWTLDHADAASLGFVSWHVIAAGTGVGVAAAWVIHSIRTTTSGSL